MDKPTREQIDEIRAWFTDERLEEMAKSGFSSSADKILALLAATTPDEPTLDPRPADMAELTRLVAVELRKRGIWADTHSKGYHVRIPQRMFAPKDKERDAIDGFICILLPQFDNLGPRAIADVIQAEEARKAREWAGDANG